MTRLYAGVDIGGSHVAVGLVDEVGNLVFTVDHQLLSNATLTADEVTDIMYDLIAQATFTLFDRDGGGSGEGELVYDGKFNSHIATVGIGCPGHCNNGVLVAASNLPLLKNAPLAAKLSARLDNIPVVLVNDADAAVAAEVWSRETSSTYRHANNVAMITLGTGIGVGLVLQRRLFSGSNGLVEAGHMIVPLPGPGGDAEKGAPSSSRRCGCGQLNCIETFASAKAVAMRYAEAVAAASRASGSNSNSNSDSNSNAVDTKSVFHLAANGDAIAERIIDEAAKSLAVLVVNLCRVVDPDVIIFGGGMSQAGEALLHRVRAHVKSTTWTVLPTTVQLVVAKSSVNAGIIGAAMAGKHEAVSAGGQEDGAFGQLMRLHGKKILAVSTAVSIASLAALLALLLRSRGK